MISARAEPPAVPDGLWSVTMRFSKCRKAPIALAPPALTGLLALFVALSLSTYASAQAASMPPTGTIRGGAVPLPRDEITPQQRARIKSTLDSNVEALRRAGRLPAMSPRVAPVSPLQWPLLLVLGHPEKVARTITNYVDHDPGYPDQLQDYNCGTRTYDQANGYNHQGTDITSFPFGWRKMDNDEAIVVAAASGAIVMKEDGQFDRSCELNDNLWNAVYVRHPDGSIAWYGHLKAGSLTSKGLGASVEAGEFLGVMGSSGDSTGPHLHLEIHDSSGQLIDPFAGSCNTFNAESWWAQQRPYNEPAIDLVMTGDAPVDFTSCPTPEVEHRSSYFQPGQLVFLTAFLTDQQRSDASVFNVYAPDGTLYATTSIASDADYYAASFWEWSVTLPMVGPAGMWRFDVAFGGKTQSVAFQVGASEPPRTEIVEYYAASLARPLLHDGIVPRAGHPRRRHSDRGMDAHGQIVPGVFGRWRRIVDRVPLLREAGSRLQHAFLHRIRLRMRRAQAGGSLDLRGQRFLYRRRRPAVPGLDPPCVPPLQQRHGRRAQPPLHDELAGDRCHAGAGLAARGSGFLRSPLTRRGHAGLTQKFPNRR